MGDNGNRRRRTLWQTYHEESPAATEFRRLHARLLHRHISDGKKAILVTSALRREGKTTTTAHFALSAAKLEGGRKVVVIDCDLRRPKLHEVFGLHRRTGLSELLSGKIVLEEAMKETLLPNLFVITAGKPVTSPSHWIGSSALIRVFRGLRDSVDLLVIDSPPVIPVSDSLVLTGECDGVLLVVMAGTTPREVVKRARDLLQDASANILGLVMNNLKETLPYYYDYRYYGYRHEADCDESGRGLEVDEGRPRMAERRAGCGQIGAVRKTERNGQS
jgi:protein-tyrosine kinase